MEQKGKVALKKIMQSIGQVRTLLHNCQRRNSAITLALKGDHEDCEITVIAFGNIESHCDYC